MELYDRITTGNYSYYPFKVIQDQYIANYWSDFDNSNAFTVSFFVRNGRSVWVVKIAP